MGTNEPLNRKLRMALVGGGQGSFIGRVHATAAVLDNRCALVAGALSSNPERAKASAPDYDIPAERAYGSYQELIDSELKLPESERLMRYTRSRPLTTRSSCSGSVPQSVRVRATFATTAAFGLIGTSRFRQNGRPSAPTASGCRASN